jgi:hypothetical protein
MTAPRLSAPPPPLRFLALVIGGWICLRAAMLLPDAWTGPATVPPSPVRAASSIPSPSTAEAAPIKTQRSGDSAKTGSVSLIRPLPYEGREAAAAVRPAAAASRFDAGLDAGFPVARASLQPSSPVAAPASAIPAQPFQLRPPIAAARRWSGSAWALLRREPGSAALTPGGTLGGSQAGARLLYRLGGALALSARAYAPLRRSAGAELALGLDWRPAVALPLNLLAERRQALGREGRSAFSVTVYGGASRALAAGLRLDVYAQAGIVGLRSRDAFADGAARIGAALGPVEIGAGAWGAAQPGTARLEAGPTLSYRLPVARANLRLEADWRLRVAGGAAPGSGPVLTLAADF